MPEALGAAHYPLSVYGCTRTVNGNNGYMKALFGPFMPAAIAAKTLENLGAKFSTHEAAEMVNHGEGPLAAMRLDGCKDRWNSDHAPLKQVNQPIRGPRLCNGPEYEG